MVVKVGRVIRNKRMPRGKERAQSVAELSAVMPLLAGFMGAVIQLGILGYAVCFANYSAFVTLRAAAVRPALREQGAARAFAAGIVERAPGLKLRSVEIHSPAQGILRLEVSLQIPRCVPLLPESLGAVRGRCAMPMEPVW